MNKSERRRASQAEAWHAPHGANRFTAPLGLESHLKRPNLKLDFIPVLDLLVIALLFSLLFTRFVMVPGVRVDLPSTDLRMQYDDASVAVLTIGNKGMLYFGGSVYEQRSLGAAFRQYLDKLDGEAAVLLVKAQADMQLEDFLELCQMAQAAGFTQVQIAGDKVEDTRDPVFGDFSGRGAASFPVIR
ncbi:MAG: biopolymer transport protein ExbD [Lentimonas sp.]|jgi:biopolymer transport protein ExbD